MRKKTMILNSKQVSEVRENGEKLKRNRESQMYVIFYIFFIRVLLSSFI